MPRIPRWSIILALMMMILLVFATTVTLAQPAGGGRGQPTPPPGGTPASRPPLVRDLQDILDDPQLALGELMQLVQTFINDFIQENQVQLQRNIDALPDATQASLVRVLSLVLGVIALLYPHSSKGLAWLFLGAVVGAVIAQLPIGDDIRFQLARGDMRFLLDDGPGTIALIVGFGIAGLIVLWPAYFMLFTAAGSFAGVQIALRVTGENPNLTEGAVIVGAILGFIIMSTIAGRATILIPMIVGAVLVVFGAGLGTGMIVPLAFASAVIATVRSPKAKERLKRVGLPTLDLQEGKIDLNPSGKQKRREHLHEIIPQMADDRDNPLIKR